MGGNERDAERAPLLQGDNEGLGGCNDATEEGVPPVSIPSSLPPPYTPREGQEQVVQCRVCQSVITLEGKEHQHVVKCAACNEATAVKPAPPGKKYVRCPCNCLLICKLSSQRIACPRPHCKRIIDLSSETSSIPAGHFPVPGSCRVVCGHCQDVFLFNTLNNALARCPNCHKVSSVGPSFARRRATIFAVIGLLFLCAGVGVTIGTFEMGGSIFIVWIVLYLIAALILARCVFYLCMRVSHIQSMA